MMHQTKVVYTQKMHCCGPLNKESTITLELMDGGGGEYLVLHAQNWALENDGVEINDLMKALKKMMVTARKETK